MVKTRPEKLLIIKPSSLGDLIQMTPAVEMLADQRPDLELSLLTEDDGYALFSESNQFSKVWHLKRKQWFGLSSEEFTAELLSLLHNLRLEKYDWVVNLHHSFRSALLMQLLSSKNRIGLQSNSTEGFIERSSEEQQLLDSFSTFCPTGTREESMAEIAERKINRSQLYKELFRPLGVDTRKHYNYRVGIDTDTETLRRFDIHHPYIVLATGNTWHSGRWPVENWIELIANLGKKKLVLVGNQNDMHRNAYITSNSQQADILNLTGKTTVKEFTNLVSLSELLIGNDSSAAHVAAAFDVPVHILFGSSPPHLCSPIGDAVNIYYKNDACPISPCGKMSCELQDIRCMQAHSPIEILNKLKSKSSNYQVDSIIST